MELIFLFFVAIAILAVGGVLFCVWLVGTVTSNVVRGVWRLLTPQPLGPRVVDAQSCANGDCRCTNPAHARFCRRCGQSLPALLRTIASRAAML